MKNIFATALVILSLIAAPQASQAAPATCITNMKIELFGPYYGGVYKYSLTYSGNATTGPSTVKRTTPASFTPDKDVLITENYLLTYVPEAGATASSMQSLASLPACTSPKFTRTIDSSAIDFDYANYDYNQKNKTCPINSTKDTWNNCNCNAGYVMVNNQCEKLAICAGGTVDNKNNCTCPSNSTLQGTLKNGSCAMVCNGGKLTTSSSGSFCTCYNGKTLINGTCGCTADQDLIGGQCVKKCIYPGVLNADKKTCGCASGYTMASGMCVKNKVTCQANATANSSDQCVCNSGYTLSGGQCVANSTNNPNNPNGGGTGGGNNSACNTANGYDLYNGQCVRVDRCEGKASLQIKPDSSSGFLYITYSYTYTQYVTTLTGTLVKSFDEPTYSYTEGPFKPADPLFGRRVDESVQIAKNALEGPNAMYAQVYKKCAPPSPYAYKTKVQCVGSECWRWRL